MKKARDGCIRQYLARRRAAFDHYGWRCVGCGESNEGFLTLDHIDDGGAKHRRVVGSDLSAWARKNQYPDDLQTLCYNCQMVKEMRRRRGTSMAAHSPPPNVEYWRSGPAKGYCCRCKIALTVNTSRPSVLRAGYGLCRYCHSMKGIGIRDRSKFEAMGIIGKLCFCCGEESIERLTIGHPNGDGKRDRLAYGRGTNFYREILKMPKDSLLSLRTECYNCNFGTYRNLGVCPHRSQSAMHSSSYYHSFFDERT